jgi:hypothetical protein
MFRDFCTPAPSRFSPFVLYTPSHSPSLSSPYEAYTAHTRGIHCIKNIQDVCSVCLPFKPPEHDQVAMEGLTAVLHRCDKASLVSVVKNQAFPCSLLL